MRGMIFAYCKVRNNLPTNNWQAQIMKPIEKLREIYNSFSAYEKYQLQLKRKIFEKQQGIRFLNLESYVNYLAMEAVIHQPDTEKPADNRNYSA